MYYFNARIDLSLMSLFLQKSSGTTQYEILQHGRLFSTKTVANKIWFIDNHVAKPGLLTFPMSIKTRVHQQDFRPTAQNLVDKIWFIEIAMLANLQIH